jgi:hypothetical protein
MYYTFDSKRLIYLRKWPGNQQIEEPTKWEARK